MTLYAKLNDQILEFYKKPSNISNISDSLLKEYAELEGYKKVNYDETPLFSEFYTITKRETTKNIYVEYAPINLEQAKLIQRETIKQSCNNARLEAFSIYSEAEQVAAQNNTDTTIATMAAVRGVTIEQQAQDIALALQMGTVINAALAGYMLRLEDAVKNATTIDEIANIVWSREDFTAIVENLLQ